MKKKPSDQQVGFLRELIERMVRAIAEHEDEVRVDCNVLPLRVVFTVRVNHEDIGLVFGELGKTADAIRRIVWTACKKTDRRVDVDFL